MCKKNEKQIAVTSMLDKFKLIIARHISKRVNTVSNAKKKIWLLILGMLTGIFCLGVIIKAMRSDNGSTSLSIEHIQSSRSLNFPIDSQPILSLENEYKRVLSFRQHLDSLYQNPEKRTTYDSIMKSRPGLSDSINQFLKQYESHYSN